MLSWVREATGDFDARWLPFLPSPWQIWPKVVVSVQRIEGWVAERVLVERQQVRRLLLGLAGGASKTTLS